MLANSRGWSSQIGAVDSERVRALEAAAKALPDEDPRRAQVLSLLAMELHFAGEPARCRALATQAIEIARAGGDPDALARTVINAWTAMWAPDTLQERTRLVDEVAELNKTLDDPRLSFWASSGNMIVGMEAGDRSRVESGRTKLRAVAASVPEPGLAWQRLTYEALWAFLHGDLQAAEQWASQGFEVGTASGQPDAVSVFGGALINVRYQQGRLGELVEATVRLAREPDSLAVLRADAALALIESGREDEARKLALAEDFQSMPWDFVWSLTMFIWADACASLGLRDRAGELHELLAPFSGQFAGAGPTTAGSFDWVLGALATTLERYEQAEGHFAAAAEIEERLGAPLFLARTRAGWARALIARGRPEDLDRAQRMLEQAETTAGRLGGELVTREVAQCRTALAASSA